MATQLNIKSEEARRLAEELARLTGKSMTEVILDALRTRLADVRNEAGLHERQAEQRRADFEQMIAGSRALWKDELIGRDHGEQLYDDKGMPA